LPQLDGLRGLAILGVMFHHFADFAGRPWPGWLGVALMALFLPRRFRAPTKASESRVCRGTCLNRGSMD
jgi:peptidoglycan/LPS O-acetylase OafA/YrhL